MANTTLSTLFTNIANAIRSKTGKTETIKAVDFPAEISNISVGNDLVISVDNSTIYGTSSPIEGEPRQMTASFEDSVNVDRSGDTIKAGTCDPKGVYIRLVLCHRYQGDSAPMIVPCNYWFPLSDIDNDGFLDIRPAISLDGGIPDMVDISDIALASVENSRVELSYTLTKKNPNYVIAIEPNGVTSVLFATPKK